MERELWSHETFGRRVKGQMLANAAKGRTRVQERQHEQEGLSLDTKENQLSKLEPWREVAEYKSEMSSRDSVSASLSRERWMT